MKKTLKPSLRFKGFTDAWEQYKLGDLGFFKSNGVDKLSKPNEFSVNLLNYMDIYNRRQVTNENAHKLMQVTAKPNQLIENSVQKNDVFFTPTSETPEDIGRVYVIEETLNNTVYSYHLMRFRPNQGTYYPNFPNYSLMSKNVRKQFFLAAKGVQRYVISKADFESIKDVIPEYGEQAKIGEFFRSIDQLITLHQRKHDRLVNVKKALLDKIFPKNDELVPSLRFKGFTDTWEQCEFGEMVDFYTGLTYSPVDITDENGTLVLRSSNVQEGQITLDDNVFVQSNVVNSDNVRLGDIIVVVRNGSKNLIGKNALVKQEMPNTVIGAFMTGVRAIQSRYIKSLLDTRQFQSEIDKNLGATINQITTGNFKKMIFKTTMNFKEQQRIGSFFDSIDSLITLHQRKYEKLVNMKKALLQKMFV